MLSSEEGRKRHNEMSVETMRKIMNTEEGRQKHKESSAETMRKIMNTEEGRQKHVRRQKECKDFARVKKQGLKIEKELLPEWKLYADKRSILKKSMFKEKDENLVFI